MIRNLTRVILSMEDYILCTIAITVPFVVIFAISAKRYRWNNPLSAYVGLFYYLDFKPRVYLAAAYLRMILLIWMIFNEKILSLPIQLLHFFLLLLTVFFYPNVKSMVTVLINGILTVIAMVFCNILLDYSRLVQINVDLGMIYILLGVFIILYNLYYFIKSLQDVSKSRSLKEEGGKVEN